MRRIIATGDSDVGKVREGNEDALLLKDSVFAVADGMGGHLAGEVASAEALKPIEALEGRIFDDATAAVETLRRAVVDANDTVSRMAIDNPSYRGMGTTLTAALVEGRRLHVAHVGDSRAYLLRDGSFAQLTDDHTFVQHLIDEGRITREEAASHPQRSVVTRAIGVSPDVEVDSLSLDLRAGDQVLLCSDGLTGVVDDATIADVLERHDDGDAAIAELIDRANAAGGPDNITVVLLRYDDDEPVATTGGASAPIAIRSSTSSDDGDWAGRLGHYGALTRGGPIATGGDDEAPQAGRILGRASAIVLGIAIIGGLVFAGGQFLLSRSYFVGLDDDEVVIFQGVDADLGPIPLARVVERTDIRLDDVSSWYHPNLEQGRPVADLNDARRIVRQVPLREAAADADAADGSDPTDDIDDTDEAGTDTDPSADGSP
jgi:PPM family protein phosphatase